MLAALFVGVALGVCLAYPTALMWFRATKKPQPHVHTPVPRSIREVKRNGNWTEKGLDGEERVMKLPDNYPFTSVLWVCATCGDCGLEDFRGQWKLEDFMRPEHLDPKKREAIISDLTRMRNETK